MRYTYIEQVYGLFACDFALIDLSLVDLFNLLPQGVEHRFNIYGHFVGVWALFVCRVASSGGVLHQEGALFDFLLKHSLSRHRVLNVLLKFHPVSILVHVFLLVLSLQPRFKITLQLESVFIFLHPSDIFEICCLHFVKDLPKLVRVLKLKFFIIVIIWHVDQMETHQLFEAVFPVFFSHTIPDLAATSACSAVATSYTLSKLVPRGLQLIVEELETDITMDLLVILEDNVVERSVLLVLVYPFALDLLKFDTLLLIHLFFKFRSR